jgi:FAD/FMN-containing dehydrogenase
MLATNPTDKEHNTMKTIDTLVEEISGGLVLPDSSDYDDSRSVWNGMIDKRPAVIARCKNVTDIAKAIKYGRAEGIPIAIRGNGHNIAGSAVCDEGIVIDLSTMKTIRVDPEARRACVEPGASLADLDAATAAYGLATPTGINSTTGIAGLTLGGGFGWLSRKFGMTCDNLVAADLVNADGELLRASAEENPDLLWALRGGGGNFGVVTQFEFELHRVGPDVLCGVIAFPGEQARQVYERFRAYTATLPDEFAVWSVLRKAPPLPFLKEQDHGRLALLLPMCYCGEPEAGEKLVAPIREFGDALGEHIGVQPFVNWQQAFDPLLTAGARNYWKSHNFTDLPDGAIDAVIRFGNSLPSPECEIFLAQMGGQTSRVPSDATAYSHRDTQYVLNVHCRWRNPADDAHCVAWAREFFAATAPFARGGVYSNFLSADETDRVTAAYGGNYERLEKIKARFDPENIFRNNINIKPA